MIWSKIKSAVFFLADMIQTLYWMIVFAYHDVVCRYLKIKLRQSEARAKVSKNHFLFLQQSLRIIRKKEKALLMNKREAESFAKWKSKAKKGDRKPATSKRH